MVAWRQRFLAHRLDGPVDAPRSGAPRRVGDEAVERMITLTLEEQPAGAIHWSTRDMARRVGMSQTMVSRVWRAFGLQPHRSETFKLSRDPAFVDKVRDVVGLYLNPPDRAMVLCVEPRGSPDIDEKPQIQVVEGTAPVLPMLPGRIERRSPRLQAPRHHRPVRRAGRVSLGVECSPLVGGEYSPLRCACGVCPG